MQLWTRHLRQTLVFMWSRALRENFNFYFFQEFFASFEKKSIFGGWTGRWGIILWSLQISWHFLVSWHPKSCVVRHLVTKLVYTMFNTINHTSFHWWLKRNLSDIKKYPIFWPWLSGNFFFAFYVFLAASFVKSSSHILAGIHFIFLKQRPRLNLKSFQY